MSDSIKLLIRYPTQDHPSGYVEINAFAARQIVSLAGLHYYDDTGRAVAPLLDMTRQIGPGIVDARHALMRPQIGDVDPAAWAKASAAAGATPVDAGPPIKGHAYKQGPHDCWHCQEPIGLHAHRSAHVDAGGEDADKNVPPWIAPAGDRVGVDLYKENVALRARLADAERRANEMEGKAGEWIAVDVHKERVESARADAVAMNKRLLGERDAAWKENARILARVAESERERQAEFRVAQEWKDRATELVHAISDGEQCVSTVTEAVQMAKETRAARDRALADLAAMTERAEKAEAKLAQTAAIDSHGNCGMAADGNGCNTMAELRAARAEVATLRSLLKSTPRIRRTADGFWVCAPNVTIRFDEPRGDITYRALIEAVERQATISLAAGVEVE